MEEKVVTEIIDNNGIKSYMKRINIVNTISRMPPHAKILMTVYVAGCVATNVASTYNTGKGALLNARKTKVMTHDEEWTVIKEACRNGSLTRFCDSVVWPVAIFSNIMPFVIQKINKIE